MKQMVEECGCCGEEVGSSLFPARRAALGYVLCLPCGELASKQERQSWCVLTPHKQGPMFFTKENARQAAIGINNKGGLVK